MPEVNDIIAYVANFVRGTTTIEEAQRLWGSDEDIKAISRIFASNKTAKTSKTTKDKTTKDPNKPKRGRSAYLFFCSEQRAHVKSSLGEHAKASEVTAELGRRWSSLKESSDPTDRARYSEYLQAADKDKKRYEIEITAYAGATHDKTEPPLKSTGRGDPSPGRSAYYFYGKENRALVREQLGEGVKAPQVTSELARRWKELKADPLRKEEYGRYLELALDSKKSMKKAAPVNEDVVSAIPILPPVVGTIPDDDDDDIENIIAELTEVPKPPSTNKVSSFRKFCNLRRAGVKKDNPEMEAPEVTAELGRIWKTLSSSERSEFE